MPVSDTSPKRDPRPHQRDCRYEPPFPNHETVLFTWSAPDLCLHLPTGLCQAEGPHPITDCMELQA